jgi:large subunit ribosomal protein L25
MKRLELKVEARTVLGKQVKQLRRKGMLPANIYGKELASTAVQLPISDFDAAFKEAGETGLIDVMLDGKRRPVLIKNIHWNHMTHTPLHADFYQVNLKEKVKSMVPLVVIGEPVAVTEKLGILLNSLDEIEVEALPEALPENIEVNVAELAAVGDQITVADLKAPEGVTVLTDESQVVARIGELAAEEEEPVVDEAAMPEVIGEKEAAEGEEAATDEEK